MRVADLPIHRVPTETLERIDSAAAQKVLSGAADMRRPLDPIANPLARVTMDDLRRSAELAQGVLDDQRMRDAWD